MATEVYYAKVKDYADWSLIVHYNGQILNDNAEPIGKAMIEKEYIFADLCNYIKEGLDTAYPTQDTKKEAAKALINYIEDYFSN